MRDARLDMENNLLVPKPSRKWHNLSYQHLTAMKIGELTPIGIIETVPGGQYKVGAETIVRLQPLASPMMHSMNIKQHTFYVPFRIIWDGFERFIQGKNDQYTGLAPIHPTFERSRLTKNTDTGTTLPSLADHFGYRYMIDGVGDNANLNPFAFAAYQKIYNHYYRHKAVTPEVLDRCVDGDISNNDWNELTKIRRITFQDDYFNLALPSPQAGGPVFVDADAQVFRNAADTTLDGTPFDVVIDGATANANDSVEAGALFARAKIIMEEIRRAARLQEFQEMSQHAQTYKDYLKAMFDANLPDFRADIPVYVNGFSQPIVVSEVTNVGDNFQGRQTANAGSYSTSEQETFFAHEHGFLITVAAVTYRPSYIAAQPRHNFKTGRFDYFHPQFDTLGERALYRGELSGHTFTLDGTFGYMPQNSEYRHTFDIITGEMATLNAHWHLGRSIERDPILTESFFEVNDERRVFAFRDPRFSPIVVQTMHHINAELPLAQLNRPTI